jgi:hypothetical protein
LIGGEQKFVCLAFTLKAKKKNALQNTYMAILFRSFGIKSLSDGGKLVRNIYGNPNSPRANKPFFPNLYKVYNLYILMDFYLVLSMEVCPRSQ